MKTLAGGHRKAGQGYDQVKPQVAQVKLLKNQALQVVDLMIISRALQLQVVAYTQNVRRRACGSVLRKNQFKKNPEVWL